jgi:hypothetical protein
MGIVAWPIQGNGFVADKAANLLHNLLSNFSSFFYKMIK